MKAFIFFFSLLFGASAFAANSLVRVDCMEGTAGAKVSLDDQYQFTCNDYQKKPIYLKAGRYTLIAVKKLSDKYQRVFEQKLVLAPNTPQRVRVILPAKTLTAYGKAELKRKQKAARIAAEASKKRAQLAAAAEAEHKRKQAVKQDIAESEAGNPEAMKRLGARYEKGDGVPQDAAKAKQWQQKSVIADLKRQKRMNRYFRYSKGGLQVLKENWKNPSDLTLMIFGFPAVLLSDSITAPFVTTDRHKVQARIDELETHAARWANPDSMVARAYQTQQPD